METLSRRSFLVASAGAAGAAALLAAPGSAVAGDGQSKTGDLSKDQAKGTGGGASDVIVHIRDAGKGEMVIYTGENEIVVTDRSLVSAIARSANGKR
jgi:hypothetical protein